MCFTIKLVAESEGLYFVWVCVLIFCEGGHFTLLPNVMKKLYGQTTTTLYGFAYSYTGVCSIIILILQNQLLNPDEASSYDAFFYACGAASCTSFILLFTFKETPFKKVE